MRKKKLKKHTYVHNRIICYSLKTIKTLLIGYILIQNKKLKKKAIGVISQLTLERKGKERKKSHLIRFRKIHQVLSLFLSSWK